MIGILEAIGFMVILFVVVAVTIYFSLKKPNANNETSKYVVYHFETDNNAPELTKLIEYHKTSNRKIKYDVAQ